MWSSVAALIYSMDMLMLQGNGLSIDNLPLRNQRLMAKYPLSNMPRYRSPFSSILRNSSNETTTVHDKQEGHIDTTTKPDPVSKLEKEQDKNLKKKIKTLIEQTIHDTKLRIETIEYLKDRHKSELHYKVGFLMSMIKKSRDMLNELFHNAVKHKDSWKALEETKILELIVHTNVDTTNLVKQLMELHTQNPNSTTLST